MKKYFFILLLIACQLTVSAQQRRPIDSQHPLWLVHVDVWNNADPQKIINLIPEDIKPYVCMNLSLSCAYDVDLDMHKKPQNAIRTYKSWATICQNNGLWFTCQPASGGHTHIQDWDLEIFEYFFKTYPNFLGWNYAEQFWGFNVAGDKFSSSDITRMALFANLVEMSHKYGGFLTVSFCGNIWSHPLNPVGMMKRNPDLLAACKKYPEAILWLYKYTTSSCFYNNESVCFGPFVAGLANNYGVRYDNCGYNGALDDLFPHDSDGNIQSQYKSQRDAMKYPVAAGIGTVMEQTCQNGGAVWDGPELIWTEDFRELGRTADSGGYTVRNWGTYPGFDNAWLDMFHKILDGTMYIPTRDEVIDGTKFIIYNDVTSGNDEDKYAMWGDAYDNLYKQTDPFNKGNGQWMQNYWYLKSTGRYGTIPMTPAFNTGFASRFDYVKKSQRTTKFPNLTKKKELFDAAYPEISKGDLFVSRKKNQLVTYTPYSYMNAKKSATANIPLKYNTCESLDLTLGKLGSGIVREFEDKIVFYLNNYRSDTTTNVTEKIVINGATSEPTFTFEKRVNATGTATGSWDAEKGAYTITVSHNGPIDLTVNCKGAATDREKDAIEITPLSLPKQPEPYYGKIIVEAEDMAYKGIGDLVDNQFDFGWGKYRSVRGHSAMGFATFGNNTDAALKAIVKIKKEGKYKVAVRYNNTVKNANVRMSCSGNTSQNLVLTKTNTNEWRKVVSTEKNFKEGNISIILTNTSGVNSYIDQIIITPADEEAEKFDITIREAEGGSAVSDVEAAAEGDIVTLTAKPAEGFELAGWDIIHGNVNINEDGTFTMPDDIVTIQPIFKDMTMAYELDFTNVIGGTFPPGWRATDGENIQQYPNTYGSGPRTMTGFPGAYPKAIYWRSTRLDYGKQSNYPLTLAPGKYVMTYAMAAWKGSPSYKAQILTSTGSVLKQTSSITASPNANGATSYDLSSTKQNTLEFEVTKEGNYVINFECSGGFLEYLLCSCKINKMPDPTDVHEIVLGTDAAKYEIYDISGKRLPRLQRGMNIIRKNGLDVRKVFVK